MLIIQHPHERFHPLGTARIAERCLRNVRIAVDYNRVLRDGTQALELPDGAAVLFPGPGARDLTSLPQSQRPSSLVVLDGTWHQARALYRDIPALHSLPRVAFDPERPSQYRIRKEPSGECVSTVEAVVHALGQIEPETRGLDNMLRVFADMIDLQIEAAAAHERNPRFPRRTRPRGHGLPRLLTQDYERIVVVQGEAALPGTQAEGLPKRALRREPKELIQWVARRLSSGERFSAVIKPRELPIERRLCPTGLSADALRNGASLAHTRHAWREFSRPTDVLLSWNKSTLDIMAPLQHEGPATFLKGIYKSFVRRHDPNCEVHGSIGAVIEREDLQAGPSPLVGRAGVRLAQLEVLTRYLHERAVNWAPQPRSAPRN